ncbi:hypothetical protein Tco_1309743 [Tanacetum coccineum]
MTLIASQHINDGTLSALQTTKRHDASFNLATTALENCVVSKDTHRGVADDFQQKTKSLKTCAADERVDS